MIFAAVSLAATSAFSQATLYTLSEVPMIADQQKSSVASVREARIDPAVSDLAADSAREIELPVFDGKTFRAERRSQEIRAMDDQTWIGEIKSDDFSGDVIITQRRGHMSGLIYTP